PRGKATNDGGGKRSVGAYAGSLLYFAALGFGFIAVELALLQNLTLLVGHPIYSLSVLLFTLLAFGGLGSDWRVGSAGVAQAGAGAAVAATLGTHRGRNCLDCPTGTGDGNAVPGWAA